MAISLTALKARLGPGLIFAAAAVGTSHVVQSTRAGAGFGLTLAVLILLICVLKYPLFRFAADYAAITDESLVRGYARRGRWLVLLMFLTSAIEAIAATAGISLVSASILQWVIDTSFDPVTSAIVLLGFTAALISLGRYRLLESITGVLVILFSLLTLVATLASVPLLTGSDRALFGGFALNRENWSFAIAVSGWMPIGNTAAIMLAAWILARKRIAPHTLAAARFDFNLGYLTSVVLALCFLIIGAAVLYGQGEPMPSGSGAFVTTFVDLYARAIGSWSTLLVAIAALAVMYSTMLAVVDGFPRMISEFIAQLTSASAGTDSQEAEAERLYLPAMLGVIIPASVLLYFFFGNFAGFIDLVTITGFLAAPLVALANQLVINGDNVPENLRPGKALVRWNQLAVVLLALATSGFLYLRWS